MSVKELNKHIKKLLPEMSEEEILQYVLFPCFKQLMKNRKPHTWLKPGDEGYGTSGEELPEE